MLDVICNEIHNYFTSDDDMWIGDFSVVNGAITPPFDIQKNQYFRIVGSVFNDGVYKYTDDLRLTDENEFHGAVWLMKVPKAFLDLVAEIEAWQAKYGGIDSPAMSPYTSESFNNYSYSKGANVSTGSGSSGGSTWQTVFAARLNPYRRIRTV